MIGYPGLSSASSEYTNAGSGGTYYVIDPATSVSASDDTHFDDVVTYRYVSDLVVGASAGGHSWPITFSLTSLATPSGSSRCSVTQGISAFATSATRYICICDTTGHCNTTGPGLGLSTSSCGANSPSTACIRQ